MVMKIKAKWKNKGFMIKNRNDKIVCIGKVAMSKAFNTYYNQYPDDERAVHAYYYDAWAHYRMGKWRDASDLFERLANKFPRARYASEALFRAGDALFNMTNRGGSQNKDQSFIDAMVFYDNHP